MTSTLPQVTCSTWKGTGSSSGGISCSSPGAMLPTVTAVTTGTRLKDSYSTTPCMGTEESPVSCLSVALELPGTLRAIPGLQPRVKISCDEKLLILSPGLQAQAHAVWLSRKNRCWLQWGYPSLCFQRSSPSGKEGGWIDEAHKTPEPGNCCAHGCNTIEETGNPSYDVNIQSDQDTLLAP